jgi:hypothetical protein
MLCTPHQISFGDLIKKTEKGRACGTYGKRRGAYRALVEKPEGSRPLGRPRRRWEDNIKMDLRKVGVEINWIDLAQDRESWWALVNAVMNLQFQLNAGNFLII